MGNTLTIEIKKTDIYTEVKKLAAYNGKKQNEATGGQSYETMNITKAEEEMLDQFFASGASMLVDATKAFITKVDSVITTDTGNKDNDGQPIYESAPGLKMTCSMPNSWNAQLADSTEATAKEFMVSWVASKWMRIVKTERETLEVADSDAKMMEYRRKLYWKMKPTLKMS